MEEPPLGLFEPTTVVPVVVPIPEECLSLVVGLGPLRDFGSGVGDLEFFADFKGFLDGCPTGDLCLYRLHPVRLASCIGAGALSSREGGEDPKRSFSHCFPSCSTCFFFDVRLSGF